MIFTILGGRPFLIKISTILIAERGVFSDGLITIDALDDIAGKSLCTT
jgi:hypothetical protein